MRPRVNEKKKPSVRGLCAGSFAQFGDVFSPLLHELPALLGRVGIREQIHGALGDQPMLQKSREIASLLPKFPIEKHDRDHGHFVACDQIGDLILMQE